MSDEPQATTPQAINVLIGIPTGEKSSPGNTTVFLNWLKLAKRWGEQGLSFCGTSEGPPSLTRDYLARTFLADKQFTHLLMLDSDHLHPVDIVERLTRWLGHEGAPQVISALNYQRKPPFRPAAFFFDNPETMGLMHLATWPQGLVKVDAVGCSAILIERSVLERMKEPWFEFHYLPVESEAAPRFIGEDIWFCHKLAALGIPVYVDTTTTCPHCGESWVEEAHFRAWVAAQAPGTLTEYQINTEGLTQEEAKSNG